MRLSPISRVVAGHGAIHLVDLVKLAGNRLQDLTTWIDTYKNVLAVLLPVWIAIRILRFTKMDRVLTLEVVREQGVTGLASSAVMSVVPELLGFLFVGMKKRRAVADALADVVLHFFDRTRSAHETVPANSPGPI